MQTAANYYIYMEMEGARMIQKEKIRGVGYFLICLLYTSDAADD